MKQFLSVCLCLAIMLSFFPTAAFAETDPVDTVGPEVTALHDVEETLENELTVAEAADAPSEELGEETARDETYDATEKDNLDPVIPSEAEDIQLSEQLGDSSTASQSGSVQNDTIETQPARVVFECDPPETVVTVYTLDEEDNKQIIEPEDDGSYLLLPGEYLYDAECDGYEAVEKVEFEVDMADEKYQSVNIALDTLHLKTKMLATRTGNLVVMTAKEFIGYLQYVVDRGDSKYGSGDALSVGKYDGSNIYFDCNGLGESIIATRGEIVYNRDPDLNPWNLWDYSCGIQSGGDTWFEGVCIDKSSDFSNLIPGEWLIKRANPYWHFGYYIGNGKVIESTTAGAYKVQVSTIDSSGHDSLQGSNWAWDYHAKAPWIDYSATSVAIRNEYPCDLTVQTDRNNLEVWTMPGNTETYPDSKVIGKLTSSGMTLHVSKIIENNASASGHYWYQTVYPGTGQTGYVYVPYTKNPKQNWTVSASDVSKPGNLSIGESFTMRGIVSTGGSTITKLQGFIYTGETTSGTAAQSSDAVYPNSTQASISDIDSSLYFNNIKAAGTYTYTVKVDLSSYTIANGIPRNETKSSFIVNDVTTTYNVGSVATYRVQGSSSFSWPTISKHINALDHYSSGALHGGIDIAASMGSSVYTVADGTVVRVRNGCSHTNGGYNHECYSDGWSSYGNYIVIEHNFGGSVYTSVYAHLKQYSNRINEGDTVYAGQLIANSGSSGSSDGAHLHLEIFDGSFRGGIQELRSHSFQYYIDNLNVLNGMTFSSHMNWSSQYYGSWIEENCDYDGDVWRYRQKVTGSPMTSGAGRTIPDGDYIIASYANPLYYLDISGSEYPAATASNVNLWGERADTFGAYDAWTVKYIGDGGFYTIKQKGTDISLDVANASRAEGANIQVCTSNGSDAQKWSISQNSDGSYRIQAKCSGMSLEIYGGDVVAGANIGQWSNHDGANQKWTFIPFSEDITITYKVDSGETQVSHKKGNVQIDKVYDLQANEYFIGYSYSPNATMFDVRPGETINLTEDITLYPVYISHAEAISGDPVLIYDINDFPSNGYNIQAATKDVSFTTTESDWGAWSNWSLDAVSGNATRQVETATLYRYYYYYCPSCGRHEPYKDWCDCNQYYLTDGDWNEKWSPIAYQNSNPQSFSYTSSKLYTISLGDGEMWIFGAGNRYDTAIGTTDSGGGSTVIETGYRYRDLVTNTHTTTKTYPAYIITKAAPTTYTITYNANGGTGAPANQTKTHDQALTLSSTKPTRANASAGIYTVTLNPNGGSVSSTSLTANRTTSYTFKNWNTAQNGSGTSYNPGASYTANAAATLYAQWNSSTSTSAVTLPTPTRSGYSFQSWATSSTAASGTTGSYTPSGNVTLYATWKANTYTITYDANGGTGAPANQTKTHDQALTLSSTTPTRADASAGSYTVTLNANGGSVNPTSLTAARTTKYSFKNWNTAQNCSGTSYNPGASYTANAAATLYAQWNSSTTTASVTLPTPTRNGYTFQGWATSNTATSGTTGSYTPTGNVTLYATWKANTYTITYNANGGTGQPENQTKTHDQTLTLSNTTPSRADASAGNYTVTLNPNGGSVSPTSLTAARTTKYTFKNWNTAQNGSGNSYNPGASYTANASTTLYAQWNSSTTTSAVTLPTPTRNGYTFQGWATSNTATGGTTGSYTPTGNATLYATWKANTYIVAYDANGGTGAPANQTKTHDVALTLSTATPTRASASAGSYTVTLNANGGSVSTSSLTAARTTSYTFKNWNTAQNGSGTSYAPGASYTANAAATLYAQWDISTTTASVTLPTPTRTGYSFQGWATSSTATSGTTGSYTPTGNVTLYATWKANTYTVSYNANGGSNPPASQTKTYDVTLTLSSTQPTRASTSAGSYTVTLNANGGSVSTTSLTANRTTNYSFKNWNTAQNGSGTSYSPGASYTANAAVTLYAQWNSNTATAAITLPTPTRSGYSFQGWATSSATSGTTGSYTPSGNVTLYATWKQEISLEDMPQFCVADVTGHESGTITVPVTIKNNPGIALFKVNVEYDENILEWTGVSHKSLNGFWSAEVGKPIVWVGDGDTEYEEDGEIFTLTFTVRESIEPQMTSIHLSYDPDDIQSWNEELVDYENVAFAVIDGRVNITSTVTLTGTALSWNNNEDVEVLLYSSDTEDSVLNSAAQSGDYSGALKAGTLGEIAASGKQYACAFIVSDVEPGTYKLLVMKPGKYVPVIRTVELNEDTTLDAITLWLYGDVTADGKVNGTDALQIKRYFADISSVFTKGTEQEKAERLIAANVTAVRSGDNKVNGTDALQIQRYFADISSVFDYMR